MSSIRSNNHRGFFWSILLILPLAGCTFYFSKSAYLDDQDTANSVLIYGYLDDSEAPFIMKEAQLKQIRPVTDEPLKDVRSNNEGLFYLENLPIGSYRLVSFEGPERGLSDSYWTWSLTDKYGKPGFERTEFRVDKPGLLYIGSYKIDKVKEGGFFTSAKYETIAIKGPSEKELLTRLKQYAQGTKWERQIVQRLAQLK